MRDSIGPRKLHSRLARVSVAVRDPKNNGVSATEYGGASAGTKLGIAAIHRSLAFAIAHPGRVSFIS